MSEPNKKDDDDDTTTFLTKGLCKWDLDVFRLEATVLPLTTVVMSVFYKCNLISLLGLDENVCINFFTAIEHKYAPYPQLTYHTSLHAADVVHSIYILLQTDCLKAQLRPLQVFSALVAAAVHDVGHPGLTNAFLCATDHPLAILYNDTSVLEHHHAAIAFTVAAQKPACNLFAALPPGDRKAARAQIIHMILHTDMAKHHKLMADSRTLIDKHGSPPLNGVLQPICLQGASAGDLDVLFSFLLHAADLGAVSKAWPLCQQWGTRIMTELFAQGDQEAALGLPVGYDRTKITLAQSQIGFIDFIGRPLWAKWNELIGVAKSPQSLAVEENRRMWEQQQKQKQI